MLCSIASVTIYHVVNFIRQFLWQVAAVAVLCVQTEPSYRPLIADVVQSLLPLVPQELGGAFRDPKAKGFSNDVSTKMLEFAPPAEAGFIERERHSLDSQRSEYSLSGTVEHSESTPNSSSSLNCSSLGASRSWEGHTRSHLEQQYDCGPGAWQAPTAISSQQLFSVLSRGCLFAEPFSFLVPLQHYVRPKFPHCLYLNLPMWRKASKDPYVYIQGWRSGSICVGLIEMFVHQGSITLYLNAGMRLFVDC